MTRPLSDCPFCPMPEHGHQITHHAYVLEPLHPVVSGHLLVIPFIHVPDFAANPSLTGHVAQAAGLFAGQMGGQWNLITSRGSAATQTVRHLHLHLVPRRQDDGLTLPWTHQQETP